MLIAIILAVAGFYVGWNIGANDAANCIGTTVGARIISFHKAALLMAAFVILGGVLQGHHVMKTVGKGIVISSSAAYVENHNELPPQEFSQYFPDEKLPDLAVFVALLSAGSFVSLATFSSLPVSTSQAIVGGVAGAGLGIVGIQTNFFKMKVLLKIFACWVISPVLTMVLAFCIYWTITYVLKSAKLLYVWNRVLASLVIGTACYVAYSLGANDIGNAIGPLLNKFPDKGRHLALGIPVSTSQAVVGAVIGVGLTKGMRAVSRRKIGVIMVGWVMAPLCAAVLAALLYRILKILV